MKNIALIALLAAAGLVQVAHAEKLHQANVVVSETSTTATTPSKKAQTDRVGTKSIGVPAIPCPEGTYLTPAGHCQPNFEVD